MFLKVMEQAGLFCGKNNVVRLYFFKVVQNIQNHLLFAKYNANLILVINKKRSNYG